MPDYNVVTYKHGFKCGDLLTVMPGMKSKFDQNGDKALIHQDINFPVSFYVEEWKSAMDRITFYFIKPLIVYQDYIEDFIVWQGEKTDINFDKSRDSRLVPMPNGSIHFYPFYVVPEMQCDLSVAWLSVPKLPMPDLKAEKIVNIYDQTGAMLWQDTPNPWADKIVVAISERYRNPYISYYFLKDFEKELIFIGTTKEHESFCSQYNLTIEKKEVKDFLEIAQIINYSRFLLSNQNACWHVADGLKKLRMLECSPAYPNTFPTGKDGYVYLHQESLVLLFKKLYEGIR